MLEFDTRFLVVCFADLFVMVGIPLIAWMIARIRTWIEQKQHSKFRFFWR